MPGLTPQRALLLSVAAALVTMAMKAGAWWFTGSIGFLSDALESLVNLAGATFALAMVSYARTPADDDHPYGHGKAEYFSAAFEGVMIFIAALAILAIAVERLLNPRALGELGLGATLSVVASAINWFVARVVLRVGRAHRSIALEADARHLMSDVWTTIGVIAGVALAAATGWYWLDPLVAIAVALNILREGGSLMRRSVGGLMDSAQSDDEIERIVEVLRSFAAQGVRYENLKTRVAGPLRFAQVELRLPGHWTVSRAHDLADEVERAVEAKTGTRLTTHVEPARD